MTLKTINSIKVLIFTSVAILLLTYCNRNIRIANTEIVNQSQNLTFHRKEHVRNLKFNSDKAADFQIIVVATMYRPIMAETDNTPNILADGTRIDTSKASNYRYIAMSRNLLERWGGPFIYGDFVMVEGAHKHDGLWQVRDTMHPRWHNRIDFLQSPSVKPFKYNNVVIRKYDHATELGKEEQNS